MKPFAVLFLMVFLGGLGYSQNSGPGGLPAGPLFQMILDLRSSNHDLQWDQLSGGEFRALLNNNALEISLDSKGVVNLTMTKLSDRFLSLDLSKSQVYLDSVQLAGNWTSLGGTKNYASTVFQPVISVQRNLAMPRSNPALTSGSQVKVKLFFTDGGGWNKEMTLAFNGPDLEVKK